jgi:hypothetical protein
VSNAQLYRSEVIDKEEKKEEKSEKVKVEAVNSPTETLSHVGRYRGEWTLTPNEKKTFTLEVPEGQEVIGGGVQSRDGWDVYTIDSYPESMRIWKFDLIKTCHKRRRVYLYVNAIDLQIH